MLPDFPATGNQQPATPLPAHHLLRALPVKLQGLLFDIDGTLVDSNDHHTRCWIEAFAHFGVPEPRLHAVSSPMKSPNHAVRDTQSTS
ncbi:MAG TPA: HAD hydrolase-like protein [Thermoanaerobaculia bacterium]